MPAPRVSVIVPTYKRPHLLRRCLKSLATQDFKDGLEVCVVDDASGPETVAVLEELSEQVPGLHWRSQPTNRGPATARNLAVAMAQGEILLFVDDDIVAPPSLVSSHARHHANGGEHVGVVGLVEWHPELTITPFMRWLDETDLQFAYRTWMRPGPISSPEKAFYTCNLSLPRSLFASSGGFDERFPYPAYEDVELGWRLGQLGLQLRYAPEALAWHARPMTLADFTKRMSMVAESAVLLRHTHPEVPIELTAPAHGLRVVATRWISSALNAWGPTVAGRDVRSRYYWAKVQQGYSDGWRRGATREQLHSAS